MSICISGTRLEGGTPRIHGLYDGDDEHTSDAGALDWGPYAQVGKIMELAEFILSECIPEQRIESEWRNNEAWGELVCDFSDVVLMLDPAGFSIWDFQVEQWIKERSAAR